MALRWGVPAYASEASRFELPMMDDSRAPLRAIMRVYGAKFAVGVWAWSRFTETPDDSIREVEALVGLVEMKLVSSGGDIEDRAHFLKARIAPRQSSFLALPNPSDLDNVRAYIATKPVRRLAVYDFALGSRGELSDAQEDYAAELAHWWDRLIAWTQDLPYDLGEP